MSTRAELESRVAFLENLLAEAQRKEAADRAAALQAEQATADAKAADERLTAAAQEKESIRRGSWVSHLLSQADPAMPVDLTQMESAIPKDPDAFPPGCDPSGFALLHGARIRPEEKVEVQNTTLGKLLLAMSPKL